MDTTQYFGIFIEESREHLDTLYNQLLELEKQPDEKIGVEAIFRAAHTLKGMSSAMGYTELAKLTHEMENVLDDLRQDRVEVSTSLIDLLFEACEQLEAMINQIQNGSPTHQHISHTIETLKTFKEHKINTGDKSKSISNDHYNLEIRNKLDEYDYAVLKESRDTGYFNYEITVHLHRDCQLKAARVFMVVQTLEKFGDIIKSQPPMPDLEAENFDSSSFTVLLKTTDTKEVIRSSVAKISEVENIAVTPFSAEQTRDQQTIMQLDKATESPAVSGTVSATGGDKSRKKPPVKQTIRLETDKLDHLMNLFEELVDDRTRLEQISQDLKHTGLKETAEHMSHVFEDMQNTILNMRMVPIDIVFNRFPRMIRQLAKDLDKQIDIDIVGAQTKLDRAVVDKIGDPLVHLIRNAVDHGIETAAERKQLHKPEQGNIKLKAYHSSSHVFIEISDDGSGINKEKVLKKALQNGVINQEMADNLEDSQIYDLIMASGFSTADTISDISGRGVGLDVVKHTIESLGGQISASAVEGKGSSFFIKLPLSLSIMPVLLVKSGDETYGIPISTIMETKRLCKQDMLNNAHNDQVMKFRNQVVPLLFLHDVFAQPTTPQAESGSRIPVVIVKKGDQLTGLVVDELIGQQEIVLKPLGDHLQNMFAIAGKAILGDGTIALIVDSNALVS